MTDQTRPCIIGGCDQPRQLDDDGTATVCAHHLVERMRRRREWNDRAKQGPPTMPQFGPAVITDRRFPGQWFLDCPDCETNKAYLSEAAARAAQAAHVCAPRPAITEPEEGVGGKGNAWSSDELDCLYAHDDWADCLASLDRGAESIKAKRRKLGLPNRRVPDGTLKKDVPPPPPTHHSRWQDWEDDIVLGDTPSRVRDDLPHRTFKAIQRRRSHLTSRLPHRSAAA